MTSRALACALVVLGCSDGPAPAIDADPASPPDARPPDARRADAPPTEFPATITGVVWAPGQAPGMVPAGHEIPVSEAVIYLGFTQMAPIDEAAHCEPCEDDGATKTDVKGNFTLEWVQPGTTAPG